MTLFNLLLLVCFSPEAIGQLPAVASVERHNADSERQIIHLCDWHWISEEASIADGGDADDYPAFLETVEAVQRDQMVVLRTMKVKRVFIEGESEKTIGDYRQKVERLKRFKPPTDDSPVADLIRAMHREDLLQIGAAGKLLMTGEIDEVLPAEDHAAWRAANPLQGDKLVFDAEAGKHREIAMVKNLAAEQCAVVVLGVAHDLREQVGEAGYVRITTKAVQKMVMPGSR